MPCIFLISNQTFVSDIFDGNFNLPYKMTRMTINIMTQTMMPARKRSRTMKIRLTTIAITRPLQGKGVTKVHIVR